MKNFSLTILLLLLILVIGCDFRQQETTTAISENDRTLSSLDSVVLNKLINWHLNGTFQSVYEANNYKVSLELNEIDSFNRLDGSSYSVLTNALAYSLLTIDTEIQSFEISMHFLGDSTSMNLSLNSDELRDLFLLFNTYKNIYNGIDYSLSYFDYPQIWLFSKIIKTLRKEDNGNVDSQYYWDALMSYSSLNENCNDEVIEGSSIFLLMLSYVDFCLETNQDVNRVKFIESKKELSYFLVVRNLDSLILDQTIDSIRSLLDDRYCK